MTRLIILISSLLMLHLIINLVRYLRTRHFLNAYLSWFKDRSWNLVQHQDEVVTLFKKAGIPDASLPVVQPAGYGQIMTATTGVFENFPSNRKDAAEIFIGMFHRAIGVYRKRLLNTFNPLYWIEFIVNLPKEVLVYLGIPAESVFIKGVQIIYWILGAVFTLAITFLKPEIEAFIRNLLGLAGKGA